MRARKRGPRIERIAHAIGEQVGCQHQRHHEEERRGERPPDHRVAVHLVARQVDHAAEAVHARIDADADVRQHRLIEDQRRELEHGDDQHQVGNVGEDVARHDAVGADAEGLRRLHVVELAQLQRFGAQQPAQPRPAGQAEHRAEQEELDVGALERGLEQVRVLVDEDLHHQHQRRDQQDVRDRTQHRVEVLDRFVDPAFEVPGHDAEHHRQRQRGERGQRTDDDRGADAFERLEQHVVAGDVGAEDVITRRQRCDGADEGAEREQRPDRGAPGDGALALPQASQRDGPALPPRQQRHQKRRQGRGHGQAHDEARQRSHSDIAGPLRCRLLQVHAAMQQPRRDARRRRRRIPW